MLSEPSRTAASSSASGMPSSRRHRSRTAAAFSASTVNPGTTAAARSLSSPTASELWSRWTEISPSSGGSDIGGTTILTSPVTPSACRLVASSCSLGHALTRVTARTAQASSRCSQLSSTSSSRLPATYSVSEDSDRPPERSCTPSALKTAWVTSNGSWIDASWTSQAPSGNPRDISAAARSASRVFPAPPLPVRVSSRVVVSRRLTSRSSGRRPTKLVRSVGRLEPLRSRASSPISAPGYAARLRRRSELRLGRAGQFNGGLDAGERDQRSLIDRPDRFEAVRQEQREKTLLAGQEDRPQITDTITTGAEPPSRRGQRGLQHSQLVVVDLRQPPFDDEQARRCQVGIHGSGGRRALAWFAHLCFDSPEWLVDRQHGSGFSARHRGQLVDPPVAGPAPYGR